MPRGSCVATDSLSFELACLVSDIYGYLAVVPSRILTLWSVRASKQAWRLTKGCFREGLRH